MTDRRIEEMVGKLLRAGVLVSAVIVAVGGAWWLIRTGGTPASYHQFRQPPQDLRHVGALLKSLAHPRPEGVIALGLILLIATPVARVALALVGFVLERDYIYVAITVLVLTILVYSMTLPFGSSAGPHATGLRRTPMDSISTSTTSPGDMRRVVPGVPVKMRSPGMSVTQRLIQLTIVAQSKMKSAVRSFWTTSPFNRV